MNYYQFDNILFESKLGRNAIARAADDVRLGLGINMKRLGAKHDAKTLGWLKNRVNQQKEGRKVMKYVFDRSRARAGR